MQGRQRVVVAVVGALVALALVGVVVAGALRDDGDDVAVVEPPEATTLPPPPPSTATTVPTTTTTAVPTTLPPETSTTTEAEVAVTTTAPATTTTTPDPEETVPPPPPTPVVLEPTGLSGLVLGSAPEPVVAELTRLLGPPDEDTGSLDARTSPYGVCPGSVVRAVRWDSLTTLFTDGETEAAPAGPPHFFAWVDSIFSATADAPPLGLRTAAGVGIGTTVADLRRAYGDAVVVEVDELTGSPAFRVRTGAVNDLFGTVTEVADSGTVESIEVPGCGE